MLAAWNSHELVGLGSHRCLRSLWLELCLLSRGQVCPPSFWGSLSQPLALPLSGGTVGPTQSVLNVGDRGHLPRNSPCSCPGPPFVPRGPLLLTGWGGGHGAQSQSSAYPVWERVIFSVWGLMGHPPHLIFNNVANEPEQKTNIIHRTELLE